MRGAVRAFALAFVVLLGGCELGPKVAQQTGYRGAGLQQISNPAIAVRQAAIPAPAYDTPPDEGQRASEVYENVPVLGGLSADRFNHLMAQITQWVAPAEEGCNYCHNPENMADDSKYTKVVARRMLQMTQNINTRWSSHVQETGVTCWTCHRGNAVPNYKWAVSERTPEMATIVRNKRGQNSPDPNVGYASLPSDPFARYFRTGASNQIRVASSSQYADGRIHHASIKDAEASYGIMMHVSQSLGVNCTYCHNSQSFRSWSLSRAQRATAYYGIRMVRDTNDGYIDSLTPVFPANRKGPWGDPYKVNCMTCHQGLSKPLGGVSMRSQAPDLWRPVAAVSTAEAAGAVPEAAPSAPGSTAAAPAEVKDAFAKPEAMTTPQ